MKNKEKCMKKIITYILLPFSITQLQADTLYGSASYHDQNFKDSLTVYGTFEGKKLETKAITIYGSADIDDSLIKGKITTYGELEIDNTTCQKEVEVFGFLEGEKTQFNKKIIAYRDVTLQDSTTVDIHIKDKEKPATIILKGSTLVEGSIKFDSGKGEVIIKDKAQVTGKVIGGSIRK
jgi:cytoskeletal protein CcmA (bactofilin family)